MVDEQLVGISAQYDAFFLFLFPIIIFAFIIKVIPLAAGWKLLHTHYPNNLSGTPSKMFHWQSARIGWASFGNTVNFGVNQYGLYIKPVAIFNWGTMKPILIPWQDLEIKLTTRWVKMLEITPKKAPHNTILIPHSLYEKMKPDIEAFTSVNTQKDVF